MPGAERTALSTGGQQAITTRTMSTSLREAPEAAAAVAVAAVAKSEAIPRSEGVVTQGRMVLFHTGQSAGRVAVAQRKPGREVPAGGT